MEYTKSPIDALNNLSIHISIGPWVLWGIFWVFIAIYGIVSAILVYHWIAYGMRARGILFAGIVFPAVSVFLVLMAISGIALF